VSTAPPKAARPYKGEELELTVESLAQGGRGIARRDDGFVVFVTGGLPGDRVRARVGKSKKGYAEASTIELVEASPDRIADTCVHDGEPCPGAPWQGLPYERQLELKAEQVGEALRRLGDLDGFETEEIVPAASEWRYRNKLEYSFGDADGDLALGFHPRGDWRRVVNVEDCHLASEANNRARNEVRDWARENGLPPHESTDERGVLRHLVVREGVRTGQVQTRLVTAPAEFPRPPVDLHTIIDGPSGGTDGPTGVLGEEYLEEELAGLRFRISHPAFFQTNTEMAETLYGIAGDYAGLDGSQSVWDLYCGIGTIGLSLASRAKSVLGLESVPEAIADAERNALRNGINNVRFVAADARLGIRPLIEQGERPDVVIVDPPRAGLSKKIVRRLIEADAPRIVYVSCNPTTLAPNAAQLVEAGYEFKRVRPVDMFPQTPHVECVALLERAER
jgi:23S rRNA (uracil1939-C5)-methyltransferase